jgi:phage protein D
MTDVISGLQIYAPAFSIKVVKTGEKIPIDSITSLEIDMSVDSPASFNFSMNESLNIVTQEFKWLDDPRIAPGTKIDISFGYASPEGKQALMRGRIKGLNPGFLSIGNPSLTVEGYDLLHDMQKKEGKMSYTDVTVSQVVAMVALDNKLKPTGIEPTARKYGIIDRKKNEKDYAFIKRLAEDLRYEFFVENDVLYFRKPRDKMPARITFELRNNIISFNPRMTSANIVNKVKASGWSEKDKAPIAATAGISDIQSSNGIKDFDKIVELSQNEKITVNLEGRILKSEEEAKEFAVAELKKRNNCFIEGSLECAGDPHLKPGMAINILKVGERFSGVYYIKGAKHSIGDGGYRTTLQVCRGP